MLGEFSFGLFDERGPLLIELANLKIIEYKRGSYYFPQEWIEGITLCEILSTFACVSALTFAALATRNSRYPGDDTIAPVVLKLLGALPTRPPGPCGTGGTSNVAIAPATAATSSRALSTASSTARERPSFLINSEVAPLLPSAREVEKKEGARARKGSTSS